MLSATNDENDVELNGETDDEDMEDGEAGFDDGKCAGEEQPRPRPTDRQGAPREHDHTSTVQIMGQVLRDGRGGERAAQEIRYSRGFGRGSRTCRWTMLKRIQKLFAGQVPEGKDWRTEGKKVRVTRREFQR